MYETQFKDPTSIIYSNQGFQFHNKDTKLTGIPVRQINKPILNPELWVVPLSSKQIFHFASFCEHKYLSPERAKPERENRNLDYPYPKRKHSIYYPL
ncbi:hypothetical protein TNIN_183071 [Trichonephila inaurata madagascariensis]|uniref:Uncharacterized protein n=1 Tax=Trichonephila inaurata madagascariensis TaxID=2747483 RepID=A0A8X6J6P0_9ARAC|nr:hypothetical protein TNIN_183071 [Trichonephila inaurata madagascariensis]